VGEGHRPSSRKLEQFSNFPTGNKTIIACGNAILLLKIAGRVTDPPLHPYIVRRTTNYNLFPSPGIDK
ncbi:MAG: hypothetical protein IJX04_09390, partial [Oscillospiraceae bacterium]|nr:hypothetical protein [Oscillospiraceae bacterium]